MCWEGMLRPRQGQGNFMHRERDETIFIGIFFFFDIFVLSCFYWFMFTTLDS
ncbi:hypothetical protein Hanom_Chr13g01229651 [Helianthus anomalus]